LGSGICGKYWQSHAYPIGCLKAVGSNKQNHQKSKTKVFGNSKNEMSSRMGEVVDGRKNKNIC
jgi:hypothetical protein